MNPRAGLIRHIRLARDLTARSAAEKALAGEKVADDVERLKEYDKVLEALRDTHRGTWAAAVVVGSICLIVATLAWSMRIPTVNVRAKIETDSVTFQVAKNWQSSAIWRLGAEPLRLDAMTEINLPPEFAPEVKLGSGAWLDLERAMITLSNVEVGRAAKLSAVQTPSSIVYFLSRNAPIRGQIHVKGETLIRGADKRPNPTNISTSLSFDVPTTFSFYSEGTDANPPQLRFGVKEKIILRDLPIDSLSFSREESGATQPPVFVSGISSGYLLIGETGERITLSEADRVSFDLLEGAIGELEIGPKVIRVSFEVKSKAVSVGGVGFEQNKVPTWLNYLYHQERLGFFLGLIAFLWSALWSTRQLLFR